MDQSREEHPRISVEAGQDWQRVKASFSEAVYARFEERLTASGLTSQRASLAKHVQQFIDSTFEKAKPNLRINGRNFEESKAHEQGPEVEPWDEALDREIWSLSNQRLQWDRELANKRRSRPQEVVNLIEDLFSAQSTAEEEDAVDEEDAEETHVGLELDEDVLAEAEQTYAKVSTLAEGLHQTVQTQQERSRRLKVVEKEIKALERQT